MVNDIHSSNYICEVKNEIEVKNNIVEDSKYKSCELKSDYNKIKNDIDTKDDLSFINNFFDKKDITTNVQNNTRIERNEIFHEILMKQNQLSIKEIKDTLKKHGYLIYDKAPNHYILEQITGSIPIVKKSPNLKNFEYKQIPGFLLSDMIKLIKSNPSKYGNVLQNRINKLKSHIEIDK